MDKKYVYKAYKTGENTLVYCPKEKWYDDGISPLTINHEHAWKPFQSDLYWINENNQSSNNFSNYFIPVAPSGKFNGKFGSRNSKYLKNMEEIGTFDGDCFSFDIPFLYTSIYELQPLDVFEFIEDQNKYSIHIPKNTKYVLEPQDFRFQLLSERQMISELYNPDKTYEIFEDAAVKIYGKVKTVRIFESNEIFDEFETTDFEK